MVAEPEEKSNRKVELPIPETLRAFTREQIVALIAFFSDKHGPDFESKELGEKYSILEKYLHNLGSDESQYQHFLNEFKNWRNDSRKESKKFETNVCMTEPSIETILNLPKVDETWSIGGYNSDNNKLQDPKQQMVQLFDGNRCARSFKTLSNMEDFELLSKDVIDILYSSMLDPVLGKPARPAKLMLKNAGLLEALKPKLQCFEIEAVVNLQQNEPAVPLNEQFACLNCGLKTKKDNLKQCTACHAVYYCSNDCFRKDWKKKPAESSHKKWCSEFQRFSGTLAQQYLEVFPFEFIEESNREEFIFEEFLKSKGLLGLGYWTSLQTNQGACNKEECSETHQQKSVSSEDDIETPYIDKRLTKLDSIPRSEDSQQFKNWAEYYNAQELTFDNPVAALLSTCMTIRYLSRVVFPKMVTDSSNKVHIVVLESAFHPKYAAIFKQLLFRECKIHVRLSIYQSKYPAFSIKYNPEGCENTSLHVNIQQGEFPVASIKSSERPDLVIGFNNFDMISEPEKSLMIVKEIVNASIPIYFVNFCPMFTAMQQQWLQKVLSSQLKDEIRVSKYLVNPFASPLRLKSSSFKFPWFQNGLFYYVTK